MALTKRDSAAYNNVSINSCLVKTLCTLYRSAGNFFLHFASLNIHIIYMRQYKD